MRKTSASHIDSIVIDDSSIKKISGCYKYIIETAEKNFFGFLNGTEQYTYQNIKQYNQFVKNLFLTDDKYIFEVRFETFGNTRKESTNYKERFLRKFPDIENPYNALDDAERENLKAAASSLIESIRQTIPEIDGLKTVDDFLCYTKKIREKENSFLYGYDDICKVIENFPAYCRRKEQINKSRKAAKKGCCITLYDPVLDIIQNEKPDVETDDLFFTGFSGLKNTDAAQNFKKILHDELRKIIIQRRDMFMAIKKETRTNFSFDFLSYYYYSKLYLMMLDLASKRS